MSTNIVLVTLKIACSVRRCKSVKTSRGFLGAGVCSGGLWCSSFLLQAAIKVTTTENVSMKSDNQ